MARQFGPDPTTESRWLPLFALLRRLDAEIEQVYVDAGFRDFRARFTKPLVRLGRRGPMSIKDLAEECGVTHSAMSQTVAALRTLELVRTAPSAADARTRHVHLTPKARPLVEFGEAEWRATEAALATLESELPYPLSQVVSDIESALSGRAFADRIREHLRPASVGGADDSAPSDAAESR